MNVLVTDLVRRAFGDEVPPLVTALAHPDHDPPRFDLGVIFSTAGPSRVYIADRVDPAGWERAVRAHVPGCERLLGVCPPGVRRMVDIGNDAAEVFLDDVQEAVPNLDPGLMCLVFNGKTGKMSKLRIVDAVPPRFSRWAALGREGMLALRTGGGLPRILWVPETRWTGRADEALTLAEAVGVLPSAFLAMQAEIPGIYIDGIEIFESGRLDLTVGIPVE